MEIPEYFAKEALSETLYWTYESSLWQATTNNCHHFFKFPKWSPMKISTLLCITYKKEIAIWYVSEQLLRKTMHSRTQQLTNKTQWFGVTLTNKGILTVTNESFLSSQPAQDVSGSNTYDLFGMNVTTLRSAVQFSTSFVRISLLLNITNNLFLYFHTKMNSK